ncbi:hypothetical protein [Streptomyces acidiscabies]|uniref:Uncharacterized protein n=1 Tax=Streptomyces acidiscabies TaxID=42234 RepID=A0ABU4MFJ0_9ACTN|nr:hypothetical protein [Streptomyces acidiscabies]MDX3025949.1 hypothetical protein [Streptomyces acidiscabies]
MVKPVGARALYDALRALEEKARTARVKSGEPYSRRYTAEKAKAEGNPKTLGNLLGVWIAEDWGKAETPDPASGPKLMAVVRVWSEWAEEQFDEPRWTTLLEKAQASRTVPPSVPERKSAFTGYNAWIEENVLAAQLVGRQQELRELAAFCTGPVLPGAPVYMWWQAAAWEGKSALVSEFVLRHRPAAVDIVSYFITDRLGRNDREDFLSVVMPQLAILAERDSSAADPRAEGFPELCRAAAEACRARGRRLVLVVDGLDEDQGAAAGERSIAALLPRRPPADMRIVVTGRPRPPVPDDVAPDHPLRAPEIIRRLSPYPGARGISALARGELHRLLKDGTAGVPLLGLLVAARGGLTSADLAAFVGVRPYNVDAMLRGITGRSFLPADHGRILLPDMPAGPVSHTFGHEELRREAVAALGDVAGFEQQIHAWADSFRARGWPEGTPDYLLYDYPHMLHSTGDHERLTVLVARDPRRQQALLSRASLDTALSEIDLTARLVRRRCPQDLEGLAGLAASRAVLNERAQGVPEDLPVALARLGHPQRALQFARVAPDPASKAVRLAKVARVLAEAGDPRAGQAARDAARWAERAREESAPPNGDEDDAESATAEAAVALYAVGDLEHGGDLLSSLRPPPWHGDVTLRCEATVQAALAARPHAPDLAAELFHQAERHADEIPTDSSTDPSTPVTAWAAVATAAGEPHATRMRERIVRYTEAFPSGLLSCLVDAAAASALAADRPDQAQRLAGQAAVRLERALHDPGSLTEGDAQNLALLLAPMLTGVTRALADTGRAEDAHRLVSGVPETRHTAFGTDVRDGARAVIASAPHAAAGPPSPGTLAAQACLLAQQNRLREANRRLHQALDTLAASPPARPSHETWLTTLCTALAAIGHHDDAARLARSVRDAAQQVRALAGVAVAAAAAGDLRAARQLADEAADQSRTLAGAGNFSARDGAPGRNVSDARAAAAQALAYAGDGPGAVALAQDSHSTGSDRRRRALVAVAAGLRSHDPAAAAAIIDHQRELLLASTSGTSPRRLGGRIADLAELLTALPATDTACADRLHQAVGRVREQLQETRTRLDAEDFLVLLLLSAPGQHQQIRQALAKWEDNSASVPPWELPTAAVAVAHAAFGDLDAARRCANGLNVPSDRAQALAAVAGYLTGAPASHRSVSHSTSAAFTRTFLALAQSQLPVDTARPAPEARSFAVDALSGDGWHHTLPVLARIAPASVIRVRDIVFAHRRLEQ